MTFFLPHPWQEPSAETQAPEGRGCPTCAHHLPQHFHGNNSEEFIDINEELGIDIDDENCERQENVQPQATATHMASTDTLATRNSCQGQSRRNIAHDINYFFQEEVQEEESLSLCNIWQHSYSYSVKSSTTTCRGHLDSQHLLVYLNKMEENNWPVKSKYLMAGSLSGKLPKFSIQGLHEFLVDFIVSDNQDTDIPHHTKTHKLVLQHWGECFMQLRVELKRAIGAVSFTADIWSADKLDSYLVMMAHWIRHELGSVQSCSGQLAMKATLITFHCLPTSHMGEEIAKAILHLIDCAEILVEKISHFTMDNATNNDTAMAAFTQTLQEEHEFDFDPVM
ncbi:hypothetical protein EDC04DRAFT_2601279 [Pisolithus marmoratus]|nr:hypothetical protein EDC04DRAFT_2601279 [Pisolithus marmoratus]